MKNLKSTEVLLDDSLPLTEIVDKLTAINRSRRNPGIENALVQLRCLAAEELREHARGTPPLPELADPFPDIDTVPEVQAQALDAITIAGAVHHHGSLIVRRLFNEETAHRLRELIDLCLNDASRALDGNMKRRKTPWFNPLPGFRPVFGEGREWLSVKDSPRAMFEVTEMFRDSIGDVIAEYLGERPLMRGSKWTMRRITPDYIGEWHQDGKFLGEGIRVINVWVALTHCGGGRPAAGFELLPKASGLLETATEGARAEFAIGTPVVERAAGALGVVDPVYEPGDAVILDQMTVHRTGSRPGLTENRYAIESWFFSPSTYPADGPSTAFCF